jgi:hypothetical protein
MEDLELAQRWYRLIESVYMAHRRAQCVPVTWHQFKKDFPGITLPVGVKKATDLTPCQLSRMVEALALIAVTARLCAVDLGILCLVAPERLKNIPHTLYGGEPDPSEKNGFCDNPPDKT